MIWDTFQAALNICHSCCHEGKRFWKVCFWEDAKAALARSHWSIQGRAWDTSRMVPFCFMGRIHRWWWLWQCGSMQDLSGPLERSESRRPGGQQSRAALESFETSKACRLGSTVSPSLTLNMSRWASIWAAFPSWARERPGETWEEQEAPKWRKLDRKFPSTEVAGSSKRTLPRIAFSILRSAKIVSAFPF